MNPVRALVTPLATPLATTRVTPLATAMVFAVLAASGCATEPPVAELPQATCTEPRPQICTMIWAPVCAVHDDGHRETHASACNACADSSVQAHTPGPCADDESTS